MMDNVKWKYNKAKHIVYERDKPGIPVSGKVDWKDGDDVTGKFIPLYTVNDRIHYPSWEQVGKEYYDKTPPANRRCVAIPIIKQEQPQEVEDELNFVSDVARSREFDLGFRTGYVTAQSKYQSQEQDKIIPDKLETYISSVEQDNVTGGEELKNKIAEILKNDINYSGQLGTYVIHGAIENLYKLITDKDALILELKAEIVLLDEAAGKSAELMVRVMELEEENGRLKDGWVSVEDKLPEVGQIVDTWNDIANRRAKFEKPDLFIRHVEPFSNERIYVTHFPDITHWRPLPTPPKPQIKPND